MEILLLILIGLIFIIILLSIPVFVLLKLIGSFYNGKNKKLKRVINIFKPIEYIYILLIICMCSIGFLYSNYGVSAGKPLTKYNNSEVYSNGYVSLSHEHILTIIVFFALGLIAYLTLKAFCNKLSPVIYPVCCSLLILNIIFTVFYCYHTSGNYHRASGNVEFPVWLLKFGYLFLSALYLAELKISLDKFIEAQRILNKEYKNKLLHMLYSISIKYTTMPILWIISLFPVLIFVQLILVLFGQQPDSFIKAFLDTSSFNYSQVPSPPPILVEPRGHYLCTVTVKGHKRLVKPLRAGIRRGNRILVNRQLLVANAFENILEEYTPKLHKFIRYIYDKYGYPLSKHINTSWSADIIYILMKPLEWFFILVLYTVDKNPENRINVQYSELRR